MFPQPTLPKRMYIYAGLSLLALGYCTGRCGHSETPPTSPAPTPLSFLEQTVTAPVQTSPPVPEPQQPVAQPPTIEQRLLRYLRNPSRNPGDPQQSDVFFKRPKIILGTDDTLWNKCRSYAREKFCDIENEARFVYKETKDYLKNRCEEAIK